MKLILGFRRGSFFCFLFFVLKMGHKYMGIFLKIKMILNLF